MKIVSLEIKRIGMGKFYPQQNEVELNILFNDGYEKEIFKVVNILDKEKAANDIIVDLRRMEKNIHKSDNSGPIIDNYVNIVIKDEDMLIKEISQYIENVRLKFDAIKSKNVADGYLDMIRELKGLKIEF
jgi:hypothetical protein